jgi:hypothetical protein
MLPIFGLHSHHHGRDLQLVAVFKASVENLSLAMTKILSLDEETVLVIVQSLQMA